MPRTDHVVAVEPALAERSADVVADTGDRAELAVVEAQRDALAGDLQFLHRSLGQVGDCTEVAPVRLLVHASNFDTRRRILGATHERASGGVAMPARALGLKGSALLLLSSLAPCEHSFAAQPAAPEAVTVITAATMIDGTGAAPRRNVAVVVRADRIVSVGDLGAAELPAGARRIDLGTATLLPGLIDAHTHIFLQGEVPAEGGYDGELLKQPLAFRAARAAASAQRALDQGFTTLRDMGTEGAGYGDVGIKQAIEGGYIPGPRLYVSTLAISSTGGYPLEDYAPELRSLPKGVQLIDGPVEARRAAREQLDHGADWLKVYMTHRSWVGADGRLVSQPTLTVEELARDRGRGPRLGAQGGLPPYNGIGLHARARRRLRLDRARPRDHRR